MPRQILVGLLCDKLCPVDIYEGLSGSRMKLVVFTESSIDWKNKKINGIVLDKGKWTQKQTNFPDVVYNRLYTSNKSIANKLEMVIGKGKVFNKITRFDKYRVYNILFYTGLKDLLIPTYIYNAKRLVNILNNGNEAIVKPVKGSLGSDVYRIVFDNGLYMVYSKTLLSFKSFHNIFTMIRYLRRRMQLRTFIIQPFIRFMKLNDHIFDIRMLVQKNCKGVWEVTADICRLTYKSSFITNSVFQIKPVAEVLKSLGYKKILPYIRQISIEAAMHLDRTLCEVSVDFGIDIDGKLWIIEINGKPDNSIFEYYDKEVFKKVILTPLEYAVSMTMEQ